MSDILKAKQAIDSLRAYYIHRTTPHREPLFEVDLEAIRDLCDGFEWLYESRAGLIANIEALREECAQLPERPDADVGHRE